MTTVLIVQPGIAPQVAQVGVTLDWLQRSVGGWIEAIYERDHEWVGFVNEEGKIMGMDFNPLAQDIAITFRWRGALGDMLVGPVVFLGKEHSEDESVAETYEDVSQEMVNYAMHRYAAVYDV